MNLKVDILIFSIQRKHRRQVENQIEYRQREGNKCVVVAICEDRQHLAEKPDSGNDNEDRENNETKPRQKIVCRIS